MSQVRAVVFDVGRVLIDFSYQGFFQLLCERGAQIVDVEDFTEKSNLIAYEHGHISTRNFFHGINALLDEPLAEEELIAAWTDLFTPIPEMFALAERLKDRCGVYLLSNTSELHWRYLRRTYPLDRVSHQLLASFEIGVMKPDPQIFSAAVARFQVQPESTVFIDDLPANIDGARACGWQGIYHRNPATTTAELTRLIGLPE